MDVRNEVFGDFLGGPVAKTPCSQSRGLGLNPGQRTRSHMVLMQPKK